VYVVEVLGNASLAFTSKRAVPTIRFLFQSFLAEFPSMKALMTKPQIMWPFQAPHEENAQG
jgi:hypothetical protein